MNLQEARRLADGLIVSMKQSCETLAIAGSIRRGKSEVKDIEIVAVPKWAMGGSLLFADEVQKQNVLLQWAFDVEARGRVQWIKPGSSEIIPWEPKRDGKYWRGLIDGKIKLDLFLAQPENFGMIFLIRTGAAEFSEAVVTQAKRIGKPCREGFLRDSGGEKILTPTEQDVFDVLNLEFVEPRLRWGAGDLHAKRHVASS